MDEDTLNAAMRILNMAKVLESHGKLNRLMDMLGDCTEITWDNQCMVERFACESVFQNTKCYEQCGKQVSHHAYEPDREVYVLRDPLLDRFHALCREYESRRGIKRFVLWHPRLYADVSVYDTPYPHFPIPRLVFGFSLNQEGKASHCRIGVVADEIPTPETPM